MKRVLMNRMLIVNVLVLMSDVHENDAGQSADQKNDVEPAMIEAELEIAENLRYDHSVLSRHVHSHQQHRGNKVHSLFYFEL